MTAPATLTPTRLDELDEMARAAQERAAKATAGPWGHKAGVLKHYCFSTDEREDFGFSQQELHWEDGHEVPAEANCVFVAHAREDVPALAAAVLALSAEIRRLWAEAARPAPRSPEDEEAMEIIRLAAAALRRRQGAEEEAGDDLATIEAAACEDKAVAKRATARPWKWWTANSMRELRSEAGRRHEVVAYGQQHPHDRVIDIAIQEPDMALIERAVNGLEQRADALLRLTAEVRRLRIREAFMAMALRAGPPPTSALASGEPPQAKEDPSRG